MNEVKVSVCIFAYNLEKFIAKAIESVLMQKADFKFEIIIGEDRSTDRTSEICIEYHKAYPDKIKLLLREQNLGMKKNVFDTLKTASGEYVAILDGDDYWIDPLKLQKQVDFMDSYPDFSLCCHNSIILYEDHNITPSLFNPRNQKEIISIEEIIMNWSMATASMLYRNSMMTFPDWVYKAHNFDIAIQILLADRGKIKYFDEPMSVYRRALGSNSFNPEYPLDYVLKRQVELFSLIDQHFNKIYSDIIQQKLLQLEKALTQIKLYKKFPFVKYFNPGIYFRRIRKIFS
jgi:glycosyltransferase involved in cell wall biosynthesis